VKPLLAAVAVAVLLCAPLSAPAATLNPQASELASMIAGAPVSAYCGDTEAEWDAIPAVRGLGGAVAGLAYLWTATVYLSPDTCAALSSGTWRAGGAALVVTHEGIHIGLETADEGLTECLAGLNVWRVLHALELPRKVEKVAYREAMRQHRALGDLPAYDWHGRC
jgi:hypothetical protein